MFKIFAIVLLLAIIGNCQLLRDEERPTRYVLPYSGLTGEEAEVEEKNYYKPNRRAERIPATAYQYDEAEEEYYRPQPQPQPQPRPKAESETYRYQATTPSHKDYEEILKHNHLARLRVAAKKQTQPQTISNNNQPQQPVEQYLKEVNPTTKTTYQRPSNYLRFSGQSSLKQENEETPLKQQSYRYILQPELQQQKSYPQYQYETQEQVKPVPTPAPKTPHFNLVAYQNALIAQQKLLAAESHEENPSKPPIYVSQSTKKTKKQKTTPPRPSSTQQYEYYPQVPPQRPTYPPESVSARYQQPLTPRNAYPKNENFQLEDPLLYPEQKELEYQTQPPVRQIKQRTTRIPRRKPKYQTEEPQEDYPSVPKYQEPKYQEPKYQEPKYQEPKYQEPKYQEPKYQEPKYQEPKYQEPKYQEEQSFDYPEPAYRRPLPRPTKPTKYEDQGEAKDDYLYQPLPKYQRESPRRQPQYSSEAEVRPRYVTRQQYQDESKQLPQYQAADLAYQPTEVAVRQSGRGPSVSYRQTYPQYQYDRRQLITPTRPFNSVDYQNVLIAEEEEPIYIHKPLESQKMLPSTQYNYHTSQRQTNTLKLAPVRYQEVEETTEDIEPEESVYNYSATPNIRYIEEQSSPSKFRPENVIKKKGLHYPRRPKKRPTYLNGQFFREEVKPFQRYEPEDLSTQPSSNVPLRYDPAHPFLILVYDE